MSRFQDASVVSKRMVRVDDRGVAVPIDSAYDRAPSTDSSEGAMTDTARQEPQFTATEGGHREVIDGNNHDDREGMHHESVDLMTTYLGVELKAPIVASASPITGDPQMW